MSTRPLYDTPMLDQLESGPWPSFVTGLKRLAKDNGMMADLMGQLETSYETCKGYWKGGTVGVFGYGGGIIPRFTELKDESGKPLFPEAAEFHTLRVQPPAGMHYTSDLLRKLCDAGYEVSLETSGALDVSMVDPRVRKVMDLKAPGSGESGRNLWSNLDHLLPHDQIKIVIASRADYEWGRAMLAEHALADRCMVLFSPVHGAVQPRELAEWIIADKLPVRFQMQLHKLLWNDAAGH